MIKVGITGGIGSGKTIFCKEWEKLGAFVLYADDFAKKLMQEDGELKEKIINAFGEQSYQEGKLNRAYLAEHAFEKERVEELNELVHPVLWERIKELQDQKEKEGVEVFAEEAAILLNHGRPESLDYVILVLADEKKRLKRVTKRDHSNVEKVEARMNKQPDFEDLIPLSDFVVYNNGSREELKEKAEAIYKKVKQIE